jgi:hypothetical protein
MTDTELFAGAVLALVFLGMVVNLIIATLFPKKKILDDHTAYGDTGGWKQDK